MSSDKKNRKFYKVMTDSHTHAGELLKKDAIVEIDPRDAELFPDVFKESAAPAPAKTDK